MKVTSSHIDEIDYNEEEQELTIMFLNGSIYIYSDVPKSVFDELVNADSHGKYFYATIRNNYVTRKER